MKTTVAFTSILAAALTLTHAQNPSTNDLWDIARGTTILAHSPFDSADGSPMPYDARNILGGAFGTYVEGHTFGNVVFTDFEADGFAHFIEWRTPAAVTIRSLRLFALGDPETNYREFATFRLKAKSPGSETFDQIVYTFTPSHPYVYLPGTTNLLLAADVSPTTAQEFRAEFVNLAGLPNGVNGPRIVELDGFGEAIGVALSIRVSEVEICWDATAGVQYQPEYRTQMSGSAWVPLGSAITGTGGRMCILDNLAPGAQQRFYRIRELN